ncbi:MAG TPA: 50S ribosomal protein L9 [Acidimicrobiales bacterium]|nr:50S ribosomal protein L9 [Acidimicrobiales bacterium]
MRVVLHTDVEGVGTKGQVVDVADGHARNLLLPTGRAVKATPGAEAQARAMRRSRAVRDATDRASAEEVAKTLVPATITVTAKAGPEGRLFGSVGTHEVADAIEAQTGIILDRRRLVVDEPIKETGEHQVTARLHPDVQFPVRIEVVGA